MRSLGVNEFSSRRKRMSIVLKEPDGTITLLMKGADSAILPRCAVTDEDTNILNLGLSSKEMGHHLQKGAC